MPSLSNNIQIVISYAQQDEELFKELDSHLAMLKMKDGVDIYVSQETVPGTEQEKVIDNQLQEADLIVLLISANALSHNYQQITKVIALYKEKETWVIPVILKPCPWQEANFSKLSPLPKWGKPVVRWNDRDEAWLNVVEGLKKIIAIVEVKKTQGQS